MTTRLGDHLSDAAKLSKTWGPPLTAPVRRSAGRAAAEARESRVVPKSYGEGCLPLLQKLVELAGRNSVDICRDA